MIDTIGFCVAALIALGSALQVVRHQNLVHAVLWLGLALVATAVLYALLDASFIAGVQVMVYVGGVITLLIFGAMITRRHDGILVLAESMKRGRAAALATGFFAVVAGAILETPYLDEVPATAVPVTTAAVIGRSLLRDNVLAFEVISFLLLGAIIGAIVIARKRDPGEARYPGFVPRAGRTAPPTTPVQETAS